MAEEKRALLNEVFTIKHFNPAKIDITGIMRILDLIPTDGIYDLNVVEARVGQYIVAMDRLGILISNLQMLLAQAEMEASREEKKAIIERATEKGIKTAQDRKIYAQDDEEYNKKLEKANEIKAYILYLDTRRASLERAHYHCKKILDRQIVDEKRSDPSRYTSPGEQRW